MSIRIKKKSRLYKLMEEVQLLDTFIFGFLGVDIQNLLLLDKIIYHAIKGRIRYHIKNYNKIFANSFGSGLELLGEKTKIKIAKSSKGEIKLNIPIYFSIKNLKKETRYSLSYSYELNRKNKSKKYAWNSQFYITGQANRTLWIYKESHNYAEMPSYPMDVMSVRNDDILCVVLPFYNFGKLVSQLTFYPLQTNPSLVTECQVEKIYSWSAQNRIKKSLDFEIEEIIQGRPQEFKTKSIKYSSLQNNYRIQLQCLKPFKSTKLLDCTVKSLPSRSPTTIVLKKKGCYNDESSRLQLREGDTLIIYFMKS